MSAFHVAPSVELQWDTEVIPIVMGWHDSADMSWRYTDKQGHEHRYEHGYPTLVEVTDETETCEWGELCYLDDEPDHEPHEVVTKSHYECRICGQTIRPGTVPPGVVQHIAGSTTATLKVDGASALLTQAEADELRSEWGKDGLEAHARRLFDSIPDERKRPY
jgi:hypothetical protein